MATADLCSTPNGIKGTYTLPIAPKHESQDCAQRLTASKEPTPPAFIGGQAQRVACSTPNGIKGTYTDGVTLNINPQFMCSTPNGIKGTYTPMRVGMRKLQRLCSTPNGIKGTYTASTRWPHATSCVLNA